MAAETPPADGTPPRHVPPGHYYSPVPSTADVDRALARAADAGPELPGVDLRTAAQLAWLEAQQHSYDRLQLTQWPDQARFRLDNTWFTNADAVAYALMLMDTRPRRVVEVGTGFSSALALDIDERFLGGGTHFTFIDPDPARLRQLCRPGELDGRLHPLPVQDAPSDVFTALARGDLLFIDSSHILKAGSDVQHLIDTVLPSLPAGVFVHFHDIFYPFEYPARWLRAGVAFNEAYAVRTLLQGDRFRVVLFIDQLRRFNSEWFAEHMPLVLEQPFETGGIWLQTAGRR